MPSKKDAPDGLKQLKAALKQGSPANLYIFFGQEDYLRDHYVEQLKRTLISGGMESFNLHVFQDKELDLQTLTEAVEAMPMMSERTLVLVYDWDLFRNEERRSGLLALFQDLPEYVCLVFVYDTMEWSGNGNTKLGKWLKANGQIVEFCQQTQSDLNAWIRRRLKQCWDKEIDNSTAEYLTFLCGGLMTNLGGEVDKVGAYAKGREVTRQDIDAVCDPVLDARAFQMTDAIGEGNYDRAMSLLSELLRMREAPIYILAAVGRQLRQIWSARLALEHKRNAAYLAQLWGMRGDWQARKLMQTARRYPLSWCHMALKETQRADLAMKLGGRDGAEVLCELLITLSLRAKEG